MPSGKEVQRSEGLENWGGVQSLVFIAANRYWLLDKESRPGASGELNAAHRPPAIPLQGSG